MEALPWVPTSFSRSKSAHREWNHQPYFKIHCSNRTQVKQRMLDGHLPSGSAEDRELTLGDLHQ